MSNHYNAADIVISVPSSDSSLEDKFNEAMYCKKPVVVSDLEWTNEILGDKNCFVRVKIKTLKAYIMLSKN